MCCLSLLPSASCTGHSHDMKRATGLVLISYMEEIHIILPTTLKSAVRKGKLRISAHQNPSEVFRKFAPPGGYKECAAICFP